MLRHEWEFEFSASKLAEAATEKRDFHNSRLEWWRKAKEDVLKEVREEGIEVDEGVDVGVLYSNKTRGPRVMVRTDLQGKLEECATKIQEHVTKAREYDGWIQVLKANSEARLKLHSDDYLFFFGK